MRLYEVKKFLESKGNCQSTEEVSLQNERKFDAHTLDTGLISRVYKELKKLNIKETA